jgi:pimeloyl-ACP methyl ester carboxylesterase
VSGQSLGWEFPFESRRLDTPSGRLAYFDEGRGEAIVFVHGLGGDYSHFAQVARPLADRFRVIGVDMPGCGSSEKVRTRVTLRSHARAVLDLLDGLGIGNATLVGHSAGGQVCAGAAVLAPGRIDRLVLINSAGLRPYPWPVRIGARILFRPWLLQVLLGLSARRILDHVFHEQNEHTRRFTADRLDRPHPPRALANIAKVFHDLIPDLLEPTILRDADKITMPTLIVWGDRDRLVPLPTVKKAASRIGACRLEILPGCGHMPIVERPDEMIELLLRFLGPVVLEVAS